MSSPRQDSHVPRHPELNFKAFDPASPVTSTFTTSGPGLDDGVAGRQGHVYRLRTQNEILQRVHSRNWDSAPLSTSPPASGAPSESMSTVPPLDTANAWSCDSGSGADEMAELERDQKAMLLRRKTAKCQSRQASEAAGAGPASAGLVSTTPTATDVTPTAQASGAAGVPPADEDLASTAADGDLASTTAAKSGTLTPPGNPSDGAGSSDDKVVDPASAGVVADSATELVDAVARAQKRHSRAKRGWKKARAAVPRARHDELSEIAVQYGGFWRSDPFLEGGGVAFQLHTFPGRLCSDGAPTIDALVVCLRADFCLLSERVNFISCAPWRSVESTWSGLARLSSMGARPPPPAPPTGRRRHVTSTTPRPRGMRLDGWACTRWIGTG